MNDFKAKFEEYVSCIEADLPHRLPEQNEQYQTLTDAMSYSLLSGGKRIRGVLILAFYQLFAESYQDALPFAAAIEMIHAYSLVHDDLPCMDDDDMRRGKPSCHVAFGESTALLAGDGLLTHAFVSAAACKGIGPDRVLRALSLLAKRAGASGMIGGQVMDLANEDKRLIADDLDAINLLKTGALMRACAEIGCILGGASEEQIRAASDYARCIGLAFQIVDDVLDVTADPEKLGKPVGSDAENHKNTYAAVCGVTFCRKRVQDLNLQAKQALSRLSGQAPHPNTAFLAELADALGNREF